MKNIGIKLADGKFYPILQDNVPSEKALTLTTAHNNQTKIMVDLFRSETNSMDDAEYVDSLQIENLVAHPNGEPNLSFSISIDADNQLSAKIVDDETGKQSNTTITLVSRTIEERLNTDEYNIKELNEESNDLQESSPKKGLLAVANSLQESGEVTEINVIEQPNTPLEEETFVEEPTIEEVTEDTNSSDQTEYSQIDLTSSSETGFDEIPTMSEEAELSLNNEIPTISEETELSLDNETPTMSEETFFTADEDISNLDIDFTVPVTPLETNSLDTFDINLDNDIKLESDDNLELNDMSFDFPDDDQLSESFDNESEINILDDSITDLGENKMNDNSNQNGGLSFTGLYDKETELGNSATTENDVRKKTKTPVIICIICAIICLIATALLLFIIPSKYNLLGKKSCNEEIELNEVGKTVNQDIEQSSSSETSDIVLEEEQEEIQIIEKAEDVIPEQPPVLEDKPKDISYKIKWGDTLWDISDTYYKNPWRYKYIARFNGINNPDHIISGTYITIPAE